jgi:hypothetical protein
MAVAARHKVPLTKFGGVRESGKHRTERGTARCLAVAKAADGPLECSVEVVFDGIPHPLSRGE